MSLATRLLLANPGAQVSAVLTGSLTTPGAKGVFDQAVAVDFLVIAGGGAGGSTYHGGGGGAGGYRTSYGTSGRSSSAESQFSAAYSTNYSVTVGAGGTVAAYVGNAGTLHLLQQ